MLTPKAFKVVYIDTKDESLHTQIIFAEKSEDISIMMYRHDYLLCSCTEITSSTSSEEHL